MQPSLYYMGPFLLFKNESIHMVSVSPIHFFSQYLDDVGDGTGGINMNGDYSVTPKEFILAPPSIELYSIYALHLVIECPAIVDSQDYGCITGGLTNSLEITIKEDDITLAEFLIGNPIKTNVDLLTLSSSIDIQTFPGGAATDVIVVRFISGSDFRNFDMYGNKNQRMIFKLNNDMTDLITHKALVYGTRRGFFAP